MISLNLELGALYSEPSGPNASAGVGRCGSTNTEPGALATGSERTDAVSDLSNKIVNG